MRNRNRSLAMLVRSAQAIASSIDKSVEPDECIDSTLDRLSVSHTRAVDALNRSYAIDVADVRRSA